MHQINFRTRERIVPDPSADGAPPVVIRPPAAEDGSAVHRLIADCPPLDANSVYCNLLQCSDFAETSALATLGDEVVGFVSGYLRPPRSDTLFVWQVAVSPAARGLGLGRRLVADILDRPRPQALRYLQATVTSSNAASWGMFRSLAGQLRARFATHVLFERERHFAGAHESEHLLTIGPFGEETE